MKRCTKCGTIKELTEYAPDNRARDGRQATCRVCQNRTAREKRAADPQKVRADDQAYRKVNLEKARAADRRSNRKRWLDNPDKIRAAVRRRYHEHPEEARAISRRSHRKRYQEKPEILREYSCRFYAKFKESDFAIKMVRAARDRERCAGVPLVDRLDPDVWVRVHYAIHRGPWTGLYVLDGSDVSQAPSNSRLDHIEPRYTMNFLVEPQWVNSLRQTDGTFRAKDLADPDKLLPHLHRIEFVALQSTPWMPAMEAWVDDHMRHLWGVADGIEALGKAYDADTARRVLR